MSFHDLRGLPIDPLAVAALYAELIGFRPALNFGHPSMPALGAAGGLAGIVALTTQALRCHVINPHGRAYVPPRALARLKVLDGANAEVAAVADGGLVNLAAGQRLGRSAADDSADAAANAGTPLQWGFAHNTTLGRTPIASPALPAGVTLATQFFRVVAVDLDWHLLDNRSATSVAGVPGDDDAVPDLALPVVRQAVPNFDYLVDGMDVLGGAGQIAAGFPPPGADVDHRHLVEHDQRRVTHDRLLVEDEAGLVDVVEADLEAAEARLLEQPDGGIEGRQLGLILAISASTRSISAAVASDTR